MPVYTDSRVDYGELRLGATIRELRKGRGWTLHDLASKLSISTANLSAIENEKAVLDTERLAAVAGVFGIRPDAMFPKNVSRHFHVVRQTALETTPAAPLNLLDRCSGTVTAHHNLRRPLADLFVGKHIEPFHAEVLPVRDEDMLFISHHYEEFFFVVRGQVEYVAQTPEGTVREVMDPGDCMYFRSNLPHCIRSADGQKAYSMTKPIRLNHLQGCIDWWGGRKRQGREEGPLSWKVTAEEVKARGYDLAIKNPHTVTDDHGEPEELLSKLTAAEAETALLRDQLKTILAEALAR